MERKIVTESCWQIRKNARESLKENWKLAILGMLLFSVLYFVVIEIFNLLFPPEQLSNLKNTMLSDYQINENIKMNNGLISGIYQLLVTGPFLIGIEYFFLNISRKNQSFAESPKIHQIFDGFNNFFKNLGIHLWMTLFVFLWILVAVLPGILAISFFSFTAITSGRYGTLIFITPIIFVAIFVIGIIVTLRYSQVYILAADNKNIGIRESLKTSIKLMKGNKGKLFILSLSYLGWIILNGIISGVVAALIGQIMISNLDLDTVQMINNSVIILLMIPSMTYISMGYVEFYKLLTEPKAIEEEITLTIKED
ncbi:MAG: DUF975 family protein [Anaerovoracaceae bacterium]